MTTTLTPDAPHPVRLTDAGDLERRRLTVFFRLILAIPHLIWLAIWAIGAILLSIVNWFATLVRGQTPDGLYRFFTAFIRYSTHVYAYLYLVAEKYPGFVGEPGYEIDVDFDPPQQQNRWTVAFRLILAIPVLILVTVISGSGGPEYTQRSGSHNGSTYGLGATGVLVIGAFLAWFFALARARAPEGIRRLQLFALHFGAQAGSYIFMLTDRYPSPDPAVLGVPRRPPPHPIALVEGDDDLERSRVTVFFRLFMAIPHLIWLALWSVVVVFVAIVNWLITLIAGQSPEGIHRFFSAYLRYTIHVQAFITLVANPFPGFTGAEGSYPVDVAIAPREPQDRLATAFRIILVIPAALMNSATNGTLFAAGFLGWFASLFTGRMPRGLRNLGAFALRYDAQTSAYGLLLLTERYPYAGPPASDLGVLQPADVPSPAPAVNEGVTPGFEPDDPRGAWKR